RALSSGAVPAATVETISRTVSTSLGQVDPKNFTVTCHPLKPVHRAPGIRSRNGATLAARPSLTASGTSTATNSRSGRASGLDARSRATTPSGARRARGRAHVGRRRNPLQIPPKQVQPCLLRPSLDQVPIAGGPECPALLGVLRRQA